MNLGDVCSECDALAVVGVNGLPLCLEHYIVALKVIRETIDTLEAIVHRVRYVPVETVRSARLN